MDEHLSDRCKRVMNFSCLLRDKGGPRQRRSGRRAGWMSICRTDVNGSGDEFLMSTSISAIRLPHANLFHTILNIDYQ